MLAQFGPPKVVLGGPPHIGSVDIIAQRNRKRNVPAEAPAQQPAQTLPPSSAQPAAAPAQQLLSNAQLDAMVSPIALYPDTLLSQVLIASTYPLEVVQADRWLDDNKKLKGDALKAAVDQQSWDDTYLPYMGDQ